MTLSQLKRDLNSATALICNFHFIENRKEKERKILKVQSNSVKTTAGWLDFPAASLLDYDGKQFTVFEQGERELTAEEKSFLKNMQSLYTEEERETYFYTSVCYYGEEAYRKTHKVSGMNGSTWYHKRLINGRKDGKLYVRDPKIRGRKLYTFTIQ